MSKNRFKRALLIGALPFVILLSIYWWLAVQRHMEYPNDRLMPLPPQLYAGLLWTLTPGATGTGNDIPLFSDTLASLARLVSSLVLSGCLALILALSMQISDVFHSILYPLVLTTAKIPPVALLPMLLLWVGVNETSKIVLLVLGLTPYLCLHLKNDLEKNSRKFTEKLSTLNLPAWQRFLYVDIPLIWPSFLHQLQTSLGSAWLFMLVAESIGAEHGLGYRIFVIRRYLAMDIILVYLVWITLLSIAFYSLFNLWKSRFRWYFNE